MTRLERLRAAYQRAMAKLRELRALDAPTVEQRTELNALLTECETLQTDIDAELRAMALDGKGDEGTATPPEGAGSGIEVVDAPVYRGSPNQMLGMQLRDIFEAQHPHSDGPAKMAARSRLERCEKRTQAQIEARENMKAAAERKLPVEIRAAGSGATMGVSSEGGILLQGETSIDLMTNGFNNSEVLSRCQQRTLTDSDYIEVIGIDETSRATGSRGGGVRVYTTAELEAMTESKTKFSKVRLEPKKLTGLFYASDELLANAAFLGAEMRQLFGEEFAFKAQDQVIRGTGVGEALGILNSGCTVSQAKVTSQTAATINTTNILAMDSRIVNDSSRSLVWLINRECKPQLATLTIVSADAATLLYKTYNNMGVRAAELNGTPCVTIEQCSALGTVGDIILADLSQYLVCNKGGIEEATSIHIKFDYNQTAFRFIYKMDGRPRWNSPITPYKGSATVSPFITLATRS